MKIVLTVLRCFVQALVIVGCAVPGVAGEHLPDSQIAIDSEDSVLAGINVNSTSLEQVLKTFGKPAEMRDETPATEGVPGSRTYVWRKRSLVLTLGTFVHGKPNLPDLIFYVSVAGTDSAIGKTGRGLKLGERNIDINKCYGNRFRKQGRMVTIEWKTGTILEIRWNRSGVINRLDLFGHKGFAQ
jgi:hypothetical protein